MKPKNSKIVDTYPDFDAGQVVGIDNMSREIWYTNMDMSKAASRVFDKRGNVVYYKNTDGVEIIRKYDRKNNLIYSNDCGNIVVDKRITRPIREKIEWLKLWYVRKPSLKWYIRYLIFRIKHYREISKALKTVKKSGE